MTHQDTKHKRYQWIFEGNLSNDIADGVFSLMRLAQSPHIICNYDQENSDNENGGDCGHDYWHPSH